MAISPPDDGLQAALHRQRFDFALEQLEKADHLLEIGAGYGDFGELARPRVRSYQGLEADPSSCDEARRRLGHPSLIKQGELRKLPFRDADFSVVVCLEMLQCTRDYRTALDEIRRVLTRRGRLILSVPYRLRGGRSKRNFHHLYEPGVTELFGELTARFGRVQSYYHCYPETAGPRLARLLGLAGLMGLAARHAALRRGDAAETEQLVISDSALGWRFGLLAIAGDPVR